MSAAPDGGFSQGEDYLGIIKWRFYGRCPHCRAEVCFKTDPQNCDYVLEWGGSRMCDPLRDQALAAERVQKEEEEKLATDRVSQVEASRQGLQQEVLALEQLAELRRLNRRLLDKTAASDAALAFLKERRIINEGDDQAGGHEWTEKERDELQFFRAARDFDSDPQSSEEEVIVEKGHIVGHAEATEGSRSSAIASSSVSARSGSSSSNAYASSSSSSSSSSSNSRSSFSSSSSSSSSNSSVRGRGNISSGSSTGTNMNRSSSPRSSTRSSSQASCVGGSGMALNAKPKETNIKTLDFGLGVCIAAPKLLVVKKPQPPDPGDCSALLGDYGSSSGEGE